MIKADVLYCFFFNDTATTEIYTLSLHDALPILRVRKPRRVLAPHAHVRPARHQDQRLRRGDGARAPSRGRRRDRGRDRKSTRLNSSHGYISYAVFCLKKKRNPVAGPVVG